MITPAPYALPEEARRRVAPDTADMLSRHAVGSASTVVEALAAINALSGEAMTLFSLHADGRLAGTLTDGDIRRGLLAGACLQDHVGALHHAAFLSLTAGAPDVFDKVALARRRGIRLLPVVDADGYITDILDLRRHKSLLPLDAVLMAGGKGERLRPLTLTTPKPLLKVGDKAIIDRNVEALASYGVKNITATVNYLREQIEEHFKLPVGGVMVRCVEEPRRLGTLGSLALAAPFAHEDVLVMNSDLLTDLDFEQMYRLHRDSRAALTVAAVPYTVSVPFAIMHTDGEKVTGLEEKPTYNYFANGGVYILQREEALRIPADTYLDAPDFVEQLIAEGKNVVYYPVKGQWTDIGSPDDFRYANELMRHR